MPTISRQRSAHRRHSSAHGPHMACFGAWRSHTSAHWSQISAQSRQRDSDLVEVAAHPFGGEKANVGAIAAEPDTTCHQIIVVVAACFMPIMSSAHASQVCAHEKQALMQSWCCCDMGVVCCIVIGSFCEGCLFLL